MEQQSDIVLEVASLGCRLLPLGISCMRLTTHRSAALIRLTRDNMAHGWDSTSISRSFQREAVLMGDAYVMKPRNELKDTTQRLRSISPELSNLSLPFLLLSVS